jgi:protein-disulfide isomerase
MKNLGLLLGTLVGTLILIVAVAVLFSRTAQPKVVANDLLIDKARHATGSAEPKVTITEFSDFQCPACAAVEPLLLQLRQEHSNQVKVVYRQFPLLSIHPYAQVAAQAAEVAAEKNKFWQFHDVLFSNQKTWAELKSEEEVKNAFAEYAQKLEIDKSEFLKRIDSPDIKDRVALDVSQGTQAGVNATPTFYVNGQETSAQQLVQTVQSLLANTK